MGSLSDNGGGWPPDGGAPDGLPGLPPEWGDIVIPDDLSDLAEEVAAVRAELRHEQRHSRWRRLTGMRRLRRLDGLRTPVLIIAMAILVTLASVWASACSGPARRPAVQRTANVSDTPTLGALELLDTENHPVPLLGQGRLPAVILLIDGCDCAQLVAATAQAVQSDVAVITVISSPAPMTVGPPRPAPTTATTTKTHRAQQLRDPTGELRRSFNLAPPDGNAAVLLVGRSAQIVRTIPRTASIKDIEPYLARL